MSDKRKYQTSQRALLIAYFEQHVDQPLSAADLATALQPAGISASAIYRNLTALVDEGVLCTLLREGSCKKYYQYLDTDACRNQLHLTCTRCGHVTHMDPSAMNRFERGVLKNDHFLIDPARTVVYGICGRCRSGIADA